MTRSLVTALALALSAVLSLAPSAHAETVTIQDPVGDVGDVSDVSRGLDIVGVTVRNLDRAVVARVQLAEVARGDVVVSVDPRGGTGVRLVSEGRSGGRHRDYVLRSAFTDGEPGPEAVVTCRGFRVRWDGDAATVTLRLPSRCLAGGDYRAIRFAALTERGSGDADWAPGTESGELGSSPWVARG